VSSERQPRVSSKSIVDLRHDVVTRQLDDVNVLGEALAAALNDHDDARAATLQASLERFALAMGWSRDKLLPAVVTYANALPALDDDLFAPAFILSSPPGRSRPAGQGFAGCARLARAAVTGSSAHEGVLDVQT
jgi:hypothetical protein